MLTSGRGECLYLDRRFGGVRKSNAPFLAIVSAFSLIFLATLFVSPYIIIVELPKEVDQFGFTSRLKGFLVFAIAAWVISLYYLFCFYKQITQELPRVVHWICRKEDILEIKPVLGLAVELSVKEDFRLQLEPLPPRFWHFVFSYVRIKFNKCYKLYCSKEHVFFINDRVAELYGTEREVALLRQ